MSEKQSLIFRFFQSYSKHSILVAFHTKFHMELFEELCFGNEAFTSCGSFPKLFNENNMHFQLYIGNIQVVPSIAIINQAYSVSMANISNSSMCNAFISNEHVVLPFGDDAGALLGPTWKLTLSNLFHPVNEHE